jgi:TusA-related sulfurtransferase
MYSFDLRESIISFSLLQITNLFSKISPGEIIEIRGIEKKVMGDIRKVLAKYESQMKITETADGNDKAFRMKIIKTEP